MNMKMRTYCVVAVLAAAFMATSLNAAQVTWNPTSAKVGVTATDFDADTTGPGSWTLVKTGDIDRVDFAVDAGGTDWAFVMDDGDNSGNDPAPSYVELAFDDPIDFSTWAVTVSFDMIFGRSGNNKELQMTGFNGTSEVFQFTWNVDGNVNGNSLDAELLGGTQSQMSASYGSQHTSNNTNYNPAKMKAFSVTLDSSATDSLIYSAEGLTDVNTDALNSNTQLTSVRWGITSDVDAAGFWLDNVVVTPAPAALPAGLALLGMVAMKRRK